MMTMNVKLSRVSITTKRITGQTALPDWYVNKNYVIAFHNYFQLDPWDEDDDGPKGGSNCQPT